MRTTTIPGQALRYVMSLLLALSPFLGAMTAKPQPAQAEVNAAACVEMIKDGAALPVVLAAKAAEGVAVATKAAACVAAGSQDPVQAVIIVALTALAVAGEISTSDQCEQLIGTAIGKLIAELFQQSGLDKALGDDVTAIVAQVAGGAATELLLNAIPPLAQWLGCGCAVAGSVGDLAALGKEAADAVKEVVDDAKRCHPAMAQVAGYFDDAVEFFEAGFDAVGNLLGDAYCTTIGDVTDDKDCRPAPTWVDCTNGNEIYGGVKQLGPATFYSDTNNQVCTCPSGTTPAVQNDSITCKCPEFGQQYFGGTCGCPAGQMLISFPGIESFCGTCPSGAETKDGKCIGCGPGAAINYDKGWLGNQSSHWAVDNKQVCETCGDRSLASADGKSCVACGDYMYKDTATLTCRYCDWSRGEILSADGKTCITEASCGENQTLTDIVSMGDGGSFKAGHCDCKDGYTWYSASMGTTGRGFADSACVPQVTCNAGQHPDQKSGVCVNNRDCGDKQVVMVQQKDATGGQWAEAMCQSCPMDKPNYNPQTNTCEADPAVMPQTTTANPADWCKGEKEVWSSKSARCVTCPPYTEKSGNTCVVRELSVSEQPKQPAMPPDLGKTAYNEPKCPGMFEDPRGRCCPYSAINTSGMCPLPPPGSQDPRTGCPVGYEPRGEFCAISDLPGRALPEFALQCPPGLIPQGAQCVVPVVWREPDLHPCPGGLAAVGRYCAAALLPSPRDSQSSCPEGYAASGSYCVARILPPQSNASAPCEGTRLPGGSCISNGAMAAAAAAAGLGAIVAGRRAVREGTGPAVLPAQVPPGRTPGPASKGGITGTPALVKGSDGTGSKSGPTIGTTTFGKPAGDDTTQPAGKSETKSGPTIKGNTVKKSSGDDTTAPVRSRTKSGSTGPGAKSEPLPKTVPARPKLPSPPTPKLTTPALKAPALKASPPTLKAPPPPTLNMPPPGSVGPRLVK